MKENRSFLKKVLEAGIECGEIAAGDLVEHVTPENLARHLPVELKAKLLGASLDAKEMTPELVVEVVGVEALAEHCPVGALWACVEAAIKRGLDGAPATVSESKPAARPRSIGARGAGAASRRAAAGRRMRARTQPDTDAPAAVPAKPNASARPDIEEVELEEGIDELVADEASSFDDAPSVFDIDTKVGGPGREAFAVGENDQLDDDTSPGNRRRRG